MTKTAKARLISPRLMSLGCAAACLVLSASNAHAGARPVFKKGNDNSIHATNNAIELGVGAGYLDYVAKDKIRTLDKERGWMPDFAFGAGFMSSESNSSWFLRNVYLHADFEMMSGNTNYSGSTCDVRGRCTARTAATENTVFAVSGKIGRGFSAGSNVMFTPFIDLGYRHWERILKGTNGYTKEYQHGEILGGLMFQYAPMRPLVLGLTGEVGSVFSPGMKTGGDTYHLQGDLMWRVKGKAGYTFTSNCELTGTIAYQGFEYGKSGVVDGGIEPDSNTRQVTTLLGFAYHFQ